MAPRKCVVTDHAIERFGQRFRRVRGIKWLIAKLFNESRHVGGSIGPGRRTLWLHEAEDLLFGVTVSGDEFVIKTCMRASTYRNAAGKLKTYQRKVRKK